MLASVSATRNSPASYTENRWQHVGEPIFGSDPNNRKVAWAHQKSGQAEIGVEDLLPFKIVKRTAEMGGVIGADSPRHSSPATKLERKMVEAMQQRALLGTSVKSFNSVIMKFPKIDESLRNCRTIFQQFDEDSNGEIDQQELKHCFQKLGIESTDGEIKDLFEACDIYEHMGMKFNEFIVFLCLVYLLNDPAVSEARKRMGLGSLEPTFETLVESFVFLDKNKDGYVSSSLPDGSYELVPSATDRPQEVLPP
ncbi:putative calcium-binding protein CML21 [Dichanthelium oligosanthes]|uniref:Putative calcium-binding protein CML21 n=1 Tax=Dichanthelium oligosanthes TaxID=888268 RepID=A0A1E5VG65_9POAL|nr:putative calcium-binding protein CML21 [Dichanthelium oligosanthes]